MGQATALPSPHVARQLCKPSYDAVPNASRHCPLPEPRQLPLPQAHHSEARRAATATAASLRCRTKRKCAPRASPETSGRSDCFRDKGRSNAEEVGRSRSGSGPELAAGSRVRLRNVTLSALSLAFRFCGQLRGSHILHFPGAKIR